MAAIRLADAALRRELGTIAPGARRAGWVLIVLGFALLVAPRLDGRWWMLGPVPSQPLALVALISGWTLWGYVIGRRTEYVRQRAFGERA